jgi:hypothetical protein
VIVIFETFQYGKHEYFTVKKQANNQNKTKWEEIHGEINIFLLHAA